MDINNFNQFADTLDNFHRFSDEKKNSLREALHSKVSELSISSLTSPEECASYEVTLSRIKEKLQEIGIDTKGISQKIRQIEQVAQKTNEKDSSIPILEAYVGWDINAADDNGAIAKNCNNAIKSEVVVVVTKSIFLKTKFPQEHQKSYRIFSQKEGGFIVLIPKKKLENHSLSSLGFMDSELDELDLEKFRQMEVPNATLEDFKGLFNREKKNSKRWILNGHGMTDQVVAGVNKEHLVGMIEFFNTIHTEMICVNTCFGGGVNALAFSSKELKNRPGFIVELNSIGDFSTYSDGTNMQERFARVNTILQEQQQHGLPTKSAMTPPIDPNDDNKIYSQQQFYFPPKSGTPPVGFRSFPSQEIARLTFVNTRGHQLVSDAPIHLKNKKRVLCYPLICTPSLILDKTSEPNLISMPQGQAHHYFQEVTLENHSLEDLLGKMLAMYVEPFKRKEETKRKAFFINQLNAGGVEYRNVVIDLGYYPARCLYQVHGDNSWKQILYDLKEKKSELLPEEGSAEVIKLIIETELEPEALVQANGGQESEKEFWHEIKENFFNGDDLLIRLYHSIRSEQEVELSESEKENYKQIIRVLSNAQKLELLQMSIKNEKKDIAALVLHSSKDLPFVPSIVSYEDCPIDKSWLLSQCPHELLDIKDSRGESGIQLALAQGDLDLVATFVQLEAEYPFGNLPPSDYTSNKEVIKLLETIYQEQKSDYKSFCLAQWSVNVDDIEGSLLNYFIKEGLVHNVKLLIGEFPEIIYENSSFDVAVRAGNLEVIGALLDEDERLAGVEMIKLAAESNHWEVVRRLVRSCHSLKSGDLPSKVERFLDEENRKVFMSNILVGDVGNAQYLIKERKVPVKIMEEALSMAIHHLKFDSIKLLVDEGVSLIKFQDDIKICRDPKIQKYLIRELYGQALHQAVAYGDEKSVKRYLKDPSCDVNFQNKFGDTPLIEAVKIKNYKMVSLLLKTADPNVGDQVPLMFAVYKNDTKMAKLLLKKKAKVNQEIIQLVRRRNHPEMMKLFN